jgi:hypothetical protein
MGATVLKALARAWGDGGTPMHARKEETAVAARTTAWMP